MPKYYPITNILKEQTVSKVNKKDSYRETFLEFSRHHQLPNTGNAEMTLTQLSNLLTGDNNLAQFDIVDGKVNSFLTDTQVGFLKVNKLYDDLVVGIVIGEYDEDMHSTYAAFVDDALTNNLNVLEEEGCNEFMLTVAGRHRTVGLLTVCDILNISPDNVTINVLVKTYETWEDAALAVLCSNKSRSMTPAERTNCMVNAAGVNTMSVTDLANHASQGIKNAKEAFALAACNLDSSHETSLTRNTVSNVAKAYITNIGKTKEGKKVIGYLAREDILNALVNVFMKALKDVPTNMNVARAASKIGADLAIEFLNKQTDGFINEATLEQGKEGTTIQTHAFPADAF